MNWDITGKGTTNFILNGAGTGGSVAERLGISWADTNRRIQYLEEQADMRELMVHRHHKIEDTRIDQRDRVREDVTGHRRNLSAGTIAGLTPEQRQANAMLLAQGGLHLS